MSATCGARCDKFARRVLRGGQAQAASTARPVPTHHHISHRSLLAHVPMDTVVLEKWLHCGFFENSNWSATEEGTPQGGIVSPALANWTLDGLESLLKRTFPTRRNKGPNLSWSTKF